MLTKLRTILNHPSLVFNKLKAAVLNGDDMMSFTANTDVLLKLKDNILKRINEMERVY